MFSANITGQIQRVIYDNKKKDAEAMVKVTLAVPKQYVPKDSDQTHIFPMITIFGYDAQYLRNYAGKGQIITAINAEADYYKNEKFEDDKGNNPDTVSFTTRKVAFQKKAVMEALLEAGVAEEPEGGSADDDDDDDRSSRRKKKSSRGGSRSERRGSSSKRGRSRDEDDDYDDEDDDEEEEKSSRRKSSSKSSSKKSSSSSKKSSSKKKPADDDDDDYDDDYDDDDDYFDDED